jgi:hypothetical protein
MNSPEKLSGQETMYPEAKFNHEADPKVAKEIFESLLAMMENKEQGN